MMTPSPIERDHIMALHALNQDHAIELSSLSLDAFESMIVRATHARAIAGHALLLTYDETADYDSTNYLWFKGRYDRFIYVDRVVVAASHRGRGIARLLYQDLFDHAQALGAPRIAAEINSDPPNPGSDAFHAAMGFVTVGEARLENRGKTVRYVMREASAL